MSAPRVTLLIIFSPILAAFAFAAFVVLMSASLPIVFLSVFLGAAGHEALADELIEYAPIMLIEKVWPSR